MGGAGPHQPKGKNQRSLEKPMSWQLYRAVMTWDTHKLVGYSSKILQVQATQQADTTIEAAIWENPCMSCCDETNMQGKAHHYKWEMNFKAAIDTMHKAI